MWNARTVTRRIWLSHLRKKKKKSRVDLEKIGEYDLTPPQEIEIIQTLGEDKLGEADELVQQEIDASPQMPDKPFLQGIFTYPFRSSVLPTLIGMAMAWTFFVLVIDGAWGLEGFGSAVAPFILGGAAFFFTLVIIPSFVTFQNIMENGANGDDETEIRPDGGLFTMVEWVGDVLPIVIAATLSCVPTLGVFHLLHAMSGDVIPRHWGIELGAGYLAYLLFPLLLLSMLENNSILGVYSKEVWGSLPKQPSSWIKFGLIATLLFGALVGACFGFLVLRNADWNTTTIVGMILAMLGLVSMLAIYFRVIGRLAFVLTSDEPIQEKRRARPDRALEAFERSPT